MKGFLMKLRYKDVKHSSWYGKPISFVLEQEERVPVKECDNCFGNGNVVTQQTEFKDEMEWEFMECPKCDGEHYIKK